MGIRVGRGVVLAAAALVLGACGGGGGGGASLVSTPPPTPTPTPTPTPPTAGPSSVTIFASPVPGEYASAGISTKDDLTDSTDRLQTLSTAEADQIRIRYDPAGFYEVQLPGSSWDRLGHYKGLLNPTSDNNYFEPASTAQNQGYLIVSRARLDGYRHSELGGWGNLNLSAEGGFGSVAFGVPTPGGSVPTSGSATFEGLVSGVSDVMMPDNLYGGHTPAGVEGTVSLGFDFGAGTLAGSTTLYLNLGIIRTRSARSDLSKPSSPRAARPIPESSTPPWRA